MVAGTGSLSFFLLYQKERFQAHASSKAHVELLEGEGRRKANWDSNWDRRNPPKKDEKEGGEVARPIATRHLILIRHGQYENWHSDGDKRVLTELGRKQARATGTGD